MSENRVLSTGLSSVSLFFTIIDDHWRYVPFYARINIYIYTYIIIIIIVLFLLFIIITIIITIITIFFSIIIAVITITVIIITIIIIVIIMYTYVCIITYNYMVRYTLHFPPNSHHLHLRGREVPRVPNSAPSGRKGEVRRDSEGSQVIGVAPDHSFWGTRILGNFHIFCFNCVFFCRFCWFAIVLRIEYGFAVEHWTFGWWSSEKLLHIGIFSIHSIHHTQSLVENTNDQVSELNRW